MDFIHQERSISGGCFPSKRGKFKFETSDGTPGCFSSPFPLFPPFPRRSMQRWIRKSVPQVRDHLWTDSQWNSKIFLGQSGQLPLSRWNGRRHPQHHPDLLHPGCCLCIDYPMRSGTGSIWVRVSVPCLNSPILCDRGFAWRIRSSEMPNSGRCSPFPWISANISGEKRSDRIPLHQDRGSGVPDRFMVRFMYLCISFR